MYRALYRAYRPETFRQLLGQEHIVKILKNQISSDRVSHAYLFCGTRGTGKTTTARLLAKGLNCLSEGERPCGECSSCQAISNGSFVDVEEIDAASARGIDQIRELRESVNYPPFLGRKKVYIIDEVHMLTAEAFNALLKTLEEPPEYVVFILATTEVQKLPATILSRCVRLDFRRVPERVISEGMRNICREMDIDVTDNALRIIAANSDGSVRDGLSILDQCITGTEGTVDVADVLEYLGASGEDTLIELTEMIRRGRTAEAIALVSELLEMGREVRQLMNDMIQHYRNLLMARFIPDPGSVIDLSDESIERIKDQASMMDPEEISKAIMELSKTMNEAKWSQKPRILLELCIVELAGRGELPRAKNAMPQVKKPMPSEPRKTPGETAPAEKREPQDMTALSKAGTLEPQDMEELEEEDDVPEQAAAAAPAEPDAPAAPTEPEIAEQPAAPAEPEIAEQPAAPTESDAPAAPAEGGAAAAPAEPEIAEQSAAPAEGGAAAGSAEPEIDLLDLWDQIFNDGASSKGSMYLIRSSSMLTSMDGTSFTVTVSEDVNRRHIENNRRMLEDLMEARIGKRLHMNIEMKEDKDEEISVEETAAQAASLIGIPVDIE